MTFDAIWSIVGPHSQLGETRSRYLHGLLRTTENLYGAIAEVGVYKGVTARLMHLTAPTTPLHLFDTFNGIVGANPAIDKHHDGEFRAELKEVKAYMDSTYVNLFYNIGPFPDTLMEVDDVPFSFVHSDLDTYFGAKSTLEGFWPCMVSGGIILFDDYLFDPCPGIAKALHEWSAQTGIEIMVSPAGGQAWVCKP